MDIYDYGYFEKRRIRQEIRKSLLKKINGEG